MVQTYKKITDKRLKWYGHVRRMLYVDIPMKRTRGRPKLRWKDECKTDMTEARLKEANATDRAEWRKKQISCGDNRFNKI